MASAARLLLALTVGWSLAAILPAPAARALTISPNPFLVLPTPEATNTSTASIELVAVQSGVPAGGTVLSGSVSPGDTTLVFRADITSGSSGFLLLAIREIGAPSGEFLPLSGVGRIPGGGVDIASGSGNVGVGFFTPVGGGVFAPDSYDLVFLSYSTPLAVDGSLEVIAGLELVPEYVGVATLVPEPKTAVLLGLGMILLSRLRRRA